MSVQQAEIPRPSSTAKTATLHLERKIGQLIQARVFGDYSNLSAPEIKQIETLITSYNIGSLDLAAPYVQPERR